MPAVYAGCYHGISQVILGPIGRHVGVTTPHRWCHWNFDETRPPVEQRIKETKLKADVSSALAGAGRVDAAARVVNATNLRAFTGRRF